MATKIKSLTRKLKGLDKGELIWSNEEISVMQEEYFLRAESLCEAPDAEATTNNVRQDEASADGAIVINYNHSHEVQYYVFTVGY